MKGILMIGSLASSLILYGIFMMTGNDSLLAFVLLGLLISFVCAMLFLSNKQQSDPKLPPNNKHRDKNAKAIRKLRCPVVTTANPIIAGYPNLAGSIVWEYLTRHFHSCTFILLEKEPFFFIFQSFHAFRKNRTDTNCTERGVRRQSCRSRITPHFAASQISGCTS